MVSPGTETRSGVPSSVPAKRACPSLAMRCGIKTGGPEMLLSDMSRSQPVLERLTGQLSPAAKVTRRTMLRYAAQFGPGLLQPIAALTPLRCIGWCAFRRTELDPADGSPAATQDATPATSGGPHLMEAFFVRWHLAGIPTSVDTGLFRLQVDRHVRRSLVLSLEDAASPLRAGVHCRRRPMLRQLAQPVRAACAGRAVEARGYGKRALDRRPPSRFAGCGRHSRRRHRARLFRRPR